MSQGMQLYGIQLQQAIETYVFGYSDERDFRPKTIVGKKEVLQRLYKYLNGSPLTIETARKYIAELKKQGWKASSRNCEIKVIRAFTRFLQKRRIILENWGPELELLKADEKPFTYIEPYIVQKIIIAGTEPSKIGAKGDNSINRHIKEETRQALLFMLKTGRRVSEVIGMRGKDLNFSDDPPSYFIPAERMKNHKNLYVPLPADMIDELKKRENKVTLFEFTAATSIHALKRGCRKLGIAIERIDNHFLRHTFATNLAKQGVPAKHIAMLLGNTEEVTLKKYIHLDIHDLNLYMNGPKSSVKEGLGIDDLFDIVEKAIRSLGVDRDNRLSLKIERGKNELHLALLPNYPI